MSETLNNFEISDRNKVPFVSVIIPVYNDVDRIENCLKALENQNYPKDRYEVIVVDNGSNENIEKVDGKYEHVRLLKESHPGSYAARNTGINSARGEILAFTDSDCVPSLEWLTKGVEALLSVPGCGQVGGNIVITFKDAGNPTIVEIYDSVTGFDVKWFLEDVHFAAGANNFIFKEAVNRVGLFNSTLKSGGDYELGRRIYAFGYKQVYSGEASVFHPARSTFKALFAKHLRIAGGDYIIPGKKLPYIKRHKIFIWAVIYILKAKRAGSVNKRVQLVLIHAIIRMISNYEVMRLFLGGIPRR